MILARVRSRAWLVLAAALFGGEPAEAAASGRPDRKLYSEAVAARKALTDSPRKQARKTEWERVVLRYRKIVANYPRSSYCDDALLGIGDLYREMSVRFKSPRYAEDAAASYRTLASEYPSSSLGEQALYGAYQIASASGSRKQIADAARRYLETFPDSKRAASVKAAMKRKAPADDLPKAPPPGLAQVFSLRFWSGEASTRVVLDVEREVPLQHDRIGSPDRLWVDLKGTRLHPNLTNPSFPVGDGMLEQVRIGQNKADVVRVVLDFKDVSEHNVFYLQDPPRLVIDVKGTASGTGTPADPVTGPATASTTPSEDGDAEPAFPPAMAAVTPRPPPTERPSAVAAATAPPSNRRGAPPVDPPADSGRTTADNTRPMPEARGSAGDAATATPPTAPQTNRAGSYSLARQLGLGARRIIIDAGHGGHDPGCIGRNGLQEKDLVLDIALRLEKLVREKLGAEVVMTRSTDVFIPLEERTGIANSRQGDLFLSIHGNAARSSKASGLETYYLNFAKDRHAESVVARENAISAGTLKDLQGLVKAIATNSKINESRDFASSVHESMVSRLRPHNSLATDRGVHTAPFYVLIGANMPSILAEVAFVTNPDEEKLLRTPEYRQEIAAGLLEGVRKYLDTLNRLPLRQLTANETKPTVPKRGRR